MIPADIPVPTENLFFLDVKTARLFAVEALLISRARTGLSVYDAYFGLTSTHLSAWAEAHIQKTDGKTAAAMLRFLRQSESQRNLLRTPENDPQAVLINEVLPVGQMVHEIMKGRSKEQAMNITLKTFLETKDGKRYEDMMSLPESTRRLSKKTLERRWAKFEDVLHYVGLFTFNHVRVLADEPTIPLCQGRTFFEEMKWLFEKHATTKQIKLPEPTFLNFVSQEEFADELSWIPPLA